MDLLGAFESSDSITSKRVTFFYICYGFLPTLHNRCDKLAPFLIADRNHSHIRHRGMLAKHLLHFGRIYIFPATDDHVLDAFRQIKKSLIVEVAAVNTGVPPVNQ